MVRPSGINGTKFEIKNQKSKIRNRMHIILVILLSIFDSLPGVQIIQDSTVGVLLDEAINGKHELVEMEGYRVQIYSSNQQQTAKTEALELETRLKDAISQTVYVQYLPPFWKVRVGDFRTYEEAREYKRQFVAQYPDLMGETYIVRDKILVMQ